MKCFGCGIEKDLNISEVSPWNEEDGLTDEPIPPLCVIECCPSEPDRDKKTWKMVVVCHSCFHKLEPDMWISENCWKGINPIIPFDKLPENNDETNKWNPEKYKSSQL